MSLKEMIQAEKSEMTPLRRTFNYVVCPIAFSMAVLSLLVGGILLAADAERFLPVFLLLAGVTVIVLAALLLAGFIVAGMEVDIELKAYAFLFEDAKPLDTDFVTVKDREAGLTFTLTEKGLKIRFPDTEEAVKSDRSHVVL